MDLRLALPADLPDIAHLHEANWRRDYAGILPQVVLGARLTTHMQALWTEDILTSARVFVVRDGETLNGFAAMRDEGRQGCARLDNLHVAPKARAQGVGRALMSAVALTAIPRALSLEVLCGNTAARKIYRCWGGQERPAFEDEVLGVKISAVTVIWQDPRALARRLSGSL